MTELEQTNDIIKSEKRSISDIEMEAAPQTSDHSAADNDDNYKKAMHRASEQRRRQKLNKGLNDLEQIILNTRKFRTSKDHIKLDKISLIENTISYIRELETYCNVLSQKSFVSGSLPSANLYQQMYGGPNQPAKNFEYIDVNSSLYSSSLPEGQMPMNSYSSLPNMMYQYPLQYNPYLNSPFVHPSSLPPQLNNWYYNQYLPNQNLAVAMNSMNNHAAAPGVQSVPSTASPSSTPFPSRSKETTPSHGGRSSSPAAGAPAAATEGHSSSRNSTSAPEGAPASTALHSLAAAAAAVAHMEEIQTDKSGAEKAGTISCTPKSASAAKASESGAANQASGAAASTHGSATETSKK